LAARLLDFFLCSILIGFLTQPESLTMRYNQLGRTGLFVSELCLGTMTFGGGEGIWRQIGDLQQARKACPSRSPASR
jgi:hypothetical protein